jgi:DNA-binding response OmpR family regulator
MPETAHRILVVDDDVSTCALITRVLEDEGQIVSVCSTGTEAVKLLRDQSFDLMLLDVSLPDMSGLDLLSVWRRRNSTKVIVITSDDTAETLITAIRNDAYLYLRKPFAPAQLKELVTAALAAREAQHIEVISAKPDWLELALPCTREAAERIDQFMRQIKIELPQEEREAVAAAFRELLMNAVEWGGGLDPSRRVRIALLRTKRMLQYRVFDPGPGFRPEELQHAAVSNAPGDMFSHEAVRLEKGMRPGGLGLMLVRAVADELLYNEKHNEVIFIKYLDQTASDPEAPAANSAADL